MVGYFFKFFYFNLLKFWWLPTLIQRPATEKRSSKKINIGQLALYLFALPFFHLFTGKSLSDALILASTNPQYDKILFIDLPVQYMKTTSSEHVVYIVFFVFNLTFKTIFVHNMSWACTFHVLNWSINEQSFVILLQE